MRFAHLADCHIGAWREPKLSDLNLKAFTSAIDECINRNVDFVLISGDLFNTSLPPIDKLKAAVVALKRLKDKEIACYCIAGSHDFSPSGKTMIEVIESAGLCINVVKGSVADGRLKLAFTLDKRTGAKITGMLGRKGSLEKSYYEELDLEELEKEDGFRIFMFHTAISELKPESEGMMESSPISLLPRGFDYYAGGHVHAVQEASLPEHRKVVFPGPLFPNSFKELEEQEGGFFIYDNGKLVRQPINVINILPINIICDGKAKELIEEEMLSRIRNTELYGTIVTLRLHGRMQGRPQDIEFRRIFERYYEKGAHFVMKNTSALSSPEFEEIKIKENENADELESRIISEHLGQIPGFDRDKEQEAVKRLLQSFSLEKEEGERLSDFTDRVKSQADSALFERFSAEESNNL